MTQKPNQPQKPGSAGLGQRSIGSPGPAHRQHALLPLQRPIDKQAVQQVLQADAGDLESGLTAMPLDGSGHDFGRISIYRRAAGAIQTPLAISKPGDEYEQEAEHISVQVMRLSAPQLSRACACGGGCPACQTKPVDQSSERLQTLHVDTSASGRTGVPPIVHAVLRSPGQPLDSAARAFFEARFGYDFSQVRIHADGMAAASARAVHARAYTVGRHVVFGVGQYAPGSEPGNRLLAHELTHVIQQSGVGRRGVLAEVALGTPVLNPNDQENGRLDLARAIFSDIYPQVTIEIGEIKPNNRKGIQDGANQLDFYRARVIALLRERHPDISVAVSYLEMPPDPRTFNYRETPACPEQALTIGGTRGLYLYSCVPPRSQMPAEECCREGHEQDEERVRQAQVAQAASRVAQEEVRQRRRRGGRRVAESAAAPGRLTRIARVAAKANLLLSAEDITLTLVGALAQYSYESNYRGTKGGSLQRTLRRLAEVVTGLEWKAGYAAALDDTLWEIDPTEAGEASAAGFRGQLLEALVSLQQSVKEVMRELAWAGKNFSAIGTRLTWDNASLVASSLTLADSIIQGGDDAPSSLGLLTTALIDVVESIAALVERLFDEQDAIVREDMEAFLERRN